LPDSFRQLPPPPDKLASPRETLKTLYFSIIAYDFRPALIDDAVACLECPSERECSVAEAARLAVELDAVLRELCLPVNAAPERPTGDTVILHDANGFRIALRRQPDGAWRFDPETVNRVPEMYRLALVRHRDLQALRSNLRDDYTDASATMRRFMVDAMTGDYYAAAMALDLSKIPIDQRGDRGPVLAQQLMFVIQRRGWIYLQEIPNNPEAPPYTWHADRNGRIALERVHTSDGKDAWKFSKNCISNLDKMYAAVRDELPDPHYTQLGHVVPPIDRNAVPVSQRPASVPAHLGSPRAALAGFFRAMSDAEADDSRLAAAIEFLDLEAKPAADRLAEGSKLAGKLDGLLRKLEIDLAAIPDSWNAPPQVLGQGQGLRVEIVRGRDGTWRFSQATVEQIPVLFDKLSAQLHCDRERSGHMETARDTMVTFLNAGNRRDDDLAARCLDLEAIQSSARDEVGPVLAFKLRYVIDRMGRVYPEEIPDALEGPRYLFQSGDLGRVVIARQTEGRHKGKWLFTAETVEQIEPMFLAAMGRPVDESLRGSTTAGREPTVGDMPGLWLRLRVPAWGRVPAGRLALYQWVGLFLTAILSWGVAKLLLIALRGIVVLTLKRSGSVLTAPFVAAKLRPLTWVCACWLFFKVPAWLDLPVTWLNTIMPARTLIMAGLLGWLGFQMIDLLMGIYMNSELLRPHRSLSDMIVPVSMRVMKCVVILLVLTYVIYEVGKGESLLRFLTGLGALGIAASLAAQDMLKSFFGTLLLIGERSFKLGDRIQVDGHVGLVEQVGFRSTRLRTPEGTLVTVPNSTIAAAAVDNQGQQTIQRHSVTVALGKDLPIEQMAALRDRLENWLRSHAALNPDETEVSIGVHREAGAELQVTFALREGTDESRVRQEINYAVLRMVQELGRPATSLRAAA
jgi:MscS family membrane protein